MTESSSEESKRFARRKFLAGAGALGAAAVAGKQLDIVGKAGEAIANYLDNPYNKYFALENGKPVISKDPNPPEKVTFTPLGGVSKYFNDNNILFREEPTQKAKDHLIAPDKIKAQYAVRVFGGSYVGEYGNLTTVYNDQEYTGGEWFMLTDENGNPVRPDNKPLGEKEAPYYTAANFVTIIPKKAK